MPSASALGAGLLGSGLVAGDEDADARGDTVGDLGAEAAGLGGELGAGPGEGSGEDDDEACQRSGGGALGGKDLGGSGEAAGRVRVLGEEGGDGASALEEGLAAVGTEEGGGEGLAGGGAIILAPAGLWRRRLRAMMWLIFGMARRRAMASREGAASWEVRSRASKVWKVRAKVRARLSPTSGIPTAMRRRSRGTRRRSSMA